MDSAQKELEAWKQLGTISADFVKVAHILQEASYEIRRRKFSNYAMFALSQEPAVIGALLIKPPEFETQWHYYATYMEELIQRGLIENQEIFQKAYKEPEEYCTLLIVTHPDSFVLTLPYPTKEDS